MKSRAEKPKSYVYAVVLVVSAVTPRFVFAEATGPEPIEAPDIRANIMKMLQESKGGDVEEDLFAEAEKQQKESAPIEKPQVPEKTEAKSATTSPQPTEPPVELPVKEFVIEDMDDLKKLAEELKKAKRRQSRQ